MSKAFCCAVVLVVAFVSGAYAVPVKPNLEKILKQEEQQQRHFEPARAGWDGPEMIRSRNATANPVFDTYGPAATVRAIRSSLLAAATPDPEVLTAIGILIVVWRIVRKERDRRRKLHVSASSGKVRRAA